MRPTNPELFYVNDCSFTYMDCDRKRELRQPSPEVAFAIGGSNYGYGSRS